MTASSPRPKRKAETKPGAGALNVERTVRELRAQLRRASDPERAISEKTYLKSPLKFHGVPVPNIRKTAREFVRKHDIERDELIALTKALFGSDYHEERSLAIALLELRASLLSKKDLAWLVDLVRATRNWAHVDWLATKVIGAVIASDKTLLRTLPKLAKDKDFWVRRTALLAQLDELRAGRGDFALFAGMAQGMLHEKEFFVRKAVGWVLRDISRKRPELTKAFVAEHKADMSALSLREATRNLS